MRTVYSDKCDEIMKRVRFSVADKTSLDIMKQYTQIKQLRDKKSAKQAKLLAQMESKLIDRLSL